MINKLFKYLRKVIMLKFKNYERKAKSPFVIYADFECILVPVRKLKTQMSLVLKNIKNMFAVIVINLVSMY